ncbi:MAG: MarR family winged helix-turn-helix transcriptional regulator [Actinomycetota bacterium]
MVHIVIDLTRLLLEARRAMADELAAELTERGYDDLRPGHAAVFLAIDRRIGSRLVDMAAEARVTKQAMMASIDELELRGYVRRVADPSDTRAKLVRLTAKGRTAAAQCRRAVTAVDQQARRRLGDRVYDTVVDGLYELAEPAEDGS